MAQLFEIHPEDPQIRLVRRAAEIMRTGGVIVYPTDSCYALGCHLGDKQAMERIQRIRQADAGHWRPVGGLGLGLAIVKELAERHGGRVIAESAGIDQGATFTVRLPYRSTRAESSPARLSGAESAAGQD